MLQEHCIPCASGTVVGDLLVMVLQQRLYFCIVAVIVMVQYARAAIPVASSFTGPAYTIRTKVGNTHSTPSMYASKPAQFKSYIIYVLYCGSINCVIYRFLPFMLDTRGFYPA